MSPFAADLAALSDLADQIAAFTARAEGVGDQLDSDLRRLHAQWSGAAADAHLVAHERWRSSSAQLRTAAEGLRRVVVVAHGNYSSAVAANLRMWD